MPLAEACSYADVRARYNAVHDGAVLLRAEAAQQRAEAERLGRMVADWSAWRIHLGRMRLWRRG